jgi:hypothetical protein
MRSGYLSSAAEEEAERAAKAMAAELASIQRQLEEFKYVAASAFVVARCTLRDVAAVCLCVCVRICVRVCTCVWCALSLLFEQDPRVAQGRRVQRPCKVRCVGAC